MKEQIPAVSAVPSLHPAFDPKKKEFNVSDEEALALVLAAGGANRGHRHPGPPRSPRDRRRPR